ncbi:MAG: hypothetical protein MK132_02210 [Lentisphaerales bacterium]|nr:hypothetical protein [Lentisphaerales bacterium]
MDNVCSIVPYFQIHEGKLEDMKKLCETFIEKTKTEDKCLYYGFCFNGNVMHCREGYEGAEGVLAHIENVGELIDEALTISELFRFEIHGNAEELAKLKEPLKSLDPEYYTWELGFRK